MHIGGRGGIFSAGGHSGRHIPDFIDDILSGSHFPEDGIILGQAAAVIGQHNKELAAVGIGAGVGHGNRAFGVIQRFRQFIRKSVSRAAGAGAGRVAALNHEAFDHAVKDHAVVETVFRQEHEVIHGLRRLY